MSLKGVAHPGTRGGLPSPRKLPVQERSRFLVSALIQACHWILENEGTDGLTMNRLADISGVAVGSIYQYFPNKEAIVTLAFEQILEEEASINVPALARRVAGLPLEQCLQEVFNNLLRIELRLFRLNRDFHLKYHADLQAGLRTGPFHSNREYLEQTWDTFIEIYAPQLQGESRDAAAYILGIGLRSMIHTTLGDNPELATQPAFRDCLVNMALACLQPPQ